MFKKILFSIGIFLTFFSVNVFAISSFFLGPSATFINLTASKVSSYNGVSPGLFLGYGGWMNPYLYLALEGLGMLEPYNAGSSNSTNNLKTRYTYGISLVPAVNLDDNLLAYLRLGYVRTSFKNLSAAKSTYLVGAGVEIPIVGCWSIRGEYNYTPYSSVVPGLGTVRGNLGTVSLIYRFEAILPGAALFA